MALCDRGISLLLKHGKEGAKLGQQSAAPGFCTVCGQGLCGKEAFLLS